MFKGHKFNQTCKNIEKKSVYHQERELLHEFLASEHENIMFEYSTSREAVNAAAMLKLYVQNVRQPLDIMQRGSNVFAVRREVKS